MQVGVLALVAILMWRQGVVDSVRIVELRVAAHMTEGSTGLLGCNFDLGDEALYSLKWYKDGREFFRYVPKAQPTMKSFFAPGVMVDLNRSSVNVVALKRLSRESGGEYQCEVKAEAPTFTRVTQHKRVVVDRIHLGAERPATNIFNRAAIPKTSNSLRLRPHEPLFDYTKLPNKYDFPQLHTREPDSDRTDVPKSNGIPELELLVDHANIPITNSYPQLHTREPVFDRTKLPKPSDFAEIHQYKHLFDHAKFPKINSFPQLHTREPEFDRAEVPRTSDFSLSHQYKSALNHAKIPENIDLHTEEPIIDRAKVPNTSDFPQPRPSEPTFVRAEIPETGSFLNVRLCGPLFCCPNGVHTSLDYRISTTSVAK